MKKIIVALVSIGVLAAIVLTLQHNKSKAEKAFEFQTFKQSAIPVTVAKVESKDLQNNLTMVGTILAGSDVNIVSELPGKIIRLYANPGDYKSAGSVIAEIDSEMKRASLMNAQAGYDKAKADYSRMETLFNEKVINASQMDQIRYAYQAAEAQLIMAKRLLKDTKITSPINGVINTRVVDQGATIGANAVIANIVDISSLKVKVNLAEKDAFALKLGDKVQITTDVYPNSTFEGRVQSIAPKADEAHTYPVEISLKNSKKEPLKAGMFSRVSFTTISKNNTIVIPRNSLIGSVKDARVFVIENGKAELKSITAGMDAGSQMEVLNGLNVGDIVVTNGQNNLKTGTKVSIINK